MSVEQNKAVLRRLYEEVWNKGDPSLLPELVSPDYRFADYKGLEGYMQLVTMQRNAFPDVRFTIDQVVGEGDWLAYQLTTNGTFKGKLGNIEPTGKAATWKRAFFGHYKDGKIVTTDVVSDALAFYQQIGVTPPAFTQTQEANKALVRRYFEMANNVKGDTSKLQAIVRELIGPEYVVHTPSGDWTLEQTLQMWNMVFTAFPDMNEKIEDIFAEGDRVVTRSTATGTHKGVFQGIPPLREAVPYE